MLPFEFKQVVIAVRSYLSDLKQKELQLSDLHAEVGKLQTAAEASSPPIEERSIRRRFNRNLIRS